MYDQTQNPEAVTAVKIKLLGFFGLFIPFIGTPFAASTYSDTLPVNLGYVHTPAVTVNTTTKDVKSAINGKNATVLSLTTDVEETGTFESSSAGDKIVRGVWAGSQAVDSTATGSTAAAFQPSHVYALNALVHPTSSNGHFYKVTTGGTSDASEPGNWNTSGGTTVSGGVTFTDQGLIGSVITAIGRTHDSIPGSLIFVYLNAVTGGAAEIFVAPNATLRGDGTSAGYDGENETSLKFAYTLLAPTNYQIPAAVGTGLDTVRVTGGYDLLNVPDAQVNTIVAALVADFTS